jgi:dATP pyrophosphohydrolase
MDELHGGVLWVLSMLFLRVQRCTRAPLARLMLATPCDAAVKIHRHDAVAKLAWSQAGAHAWQMEWPAVVEPRPFKIPESVLVVIHTPALQVLLIQRADRPDSWQSVTGSLDSVGEPLAETARREVLEETGISHGELRDWQHTNVYEIWATWAHRYAPGATHNTEHVFGLTLPQTQPVVLSPREHLAFKWLPWREAADACFSPSNREAILMLPQQLGGGLRTT